MCNLNNTLPYEQVTLTNHNDFFEAMLIFNKNRWFFRGHSSVDWDLKTTFERKFDYGNRKNAQILEWSSIQTFKKDAIRFFDYGSPIEWLSTMQHFGAPTRLLDFTESIMVALYFALENIENGKDGCIWAIRQDDIWNGQEYFKHEKFSEDDDPDDRVSTQMFIEYNIVERNTQSLEFADSLIRNESPLTSYSNVSDSPKKGVIPIFPQISNERLSAQSGLFLMLRDFSASFDINLHESLSPSKAKSEFEHLQKKADSERYGFKGEKVVKVVKVVLPWTFLQQTPQLLKSANVTPKTLFPGMDGIGKAIRFFPHS